MHRRERPAVDDGNEGDDVPDGAPNAGRPRPDGAPNGGDPRPDGAAGNGGAGGDGPDFGPGGYLPADAARRARKIVLRAPLGLQWIVATVIAGAVVVVAGVLFLGSSGGPPGAPHIRIGEVAAIGDATLLDDPPALVVGAGGRVRAFVVGPQAPRFCPASGRLESADGRTWSLTGRALDGGASLSEHPVIVSDGVAYVDPTTTVPGPRATDRDAQPACQPGDLVP